MQATCSASDILYNLQYYQSSLSTMLTNPYNAVVHPTIKYNNNNSRWQSWTYTVRCAKQIKKMIWSKPRNNSFVFLFLSSSFKICCSVSWHCTVFSATCQDAATEGSCVSLRRRVQKVLEMCRIIWMTSPRHKEASCMYKSYIANCRQSGGVLWSTTINL